MTDDFTVSLSDHKVPERAVGAKPFGNTGCNSYQVLLLCSPLSAKASALLEKG